MNPARLTSVPADQAAAVARLVRRVCLLREQGAAAAVLRQAEDELEEQVQEHRLRHGNDSLPEDRLEALFVGEAVRVADATILAELLRPMLAGTRPAAGPAGPGREPIRPARRPAAGPAPEIAALLDDMLVVERSRAGRTH